MSSHVYTPCDKSKLISIYPKCFTICSANAVICLFISYNKILILIFSDCVVDELKLATEGLIDAYGKQQAPEYVTQTFSLHSHF